MSILPTVQVNQAEPSKSLLVERGGDTTEDFVLAHSAVQWKTCCKGCDAPQHMLNGKACLVACTAQTVPDS